MRIAITAGGATLAVVATALTGCSSNGGTAEASAGGMAIVVGAHANSPAPEMVDGVQTVMRNAVQRHESATVITNQGTPEVARLNLKYDAANSDSQRQQANSNLRSLAAAVRQARARTPENNLLAAIDLAARSIGGTAGTKSIVVIDNGLQTVAPLTMQEPGMLSADPTEVADFLHKSGALPNLTGIDVTLSGIGDTHAPQSPLTRAQRTNLIAVWTAVLQRAGGHVAALEQPLTGQPTDGVPAVTTVSVGTVQSFAGSGTPTKVELDSDTVAFRPNQATYLDAANVQQTLRPLAEKIVVHRLRVTLTGTTATSGTQQGRAALSRKRAEAVKATLVDLGVNPTMITTRGVGTNWPGHLTDTATDGTLLPGPAARNRKVIVELTRP